jgi:hypothetical protein
LGATNYIRKDTPKEEIAKALQETLEANFDLTENDGPNHEPSV